MEQFPNNNNPEENTNQGPTATEKSNNFEPFDKEKAQQLRDGYIQNQADKEQLTEDFLEKYQTYEDTVNALDNIEGQLYWRKVLSKLQAALSQPNAIDLNEQNEPKWLEYFTSEGKYSAIKDAFFINAIEDDKYNNDDPKYHAYINKRFSIKTSDSYYVDDVFPEDTDFSVENNYKNNDVPKRISHVLAELFDDNVFTEEEKDFIDASALDKRGAVFKHLDYMRYPDKDTLDRVFSEIVDIIDDIGDTNDLENKRNLLESKVRVFEEAEEKAEK